MLQKRAPGADTEGVRVSLPDAVTPQKKPTFGGLEAPVRHLGYIDGLRAIAALAVVVYHAYVNALLDPAQDRLGTRVLMLGAHGVDLFFVISGFCLAYPTLARVRSGTGLRFDVATYAARRIVRIVPPYYAAIATLVCIYLALHLHSPGLAPWPLVAQLLFLDRDQSFLASPFWTLAIELRWYFAFPLLLGLYVRSPRAFALLGVAAYVCYYMTRLNAIDVGTLPAFMFGIWAADLQVTQSPLRRYALAVGIPCAFASLAIPSGPEFYAVQPVGVLAAASLLVAAGTIGWLRRALQARVFTVFGVASYSLYLMHKPVIEYMETFRHSPPGAAALVAVAFAMAFWAIFERPWLAPRLRDPATRWVRRRIEPADRWLQTSSLLRMGSGSS